MHHDLVWYSLLKGYTCIISTVNLWCYCMVEDNLDTRNRRKDLSYQKLKNPKATDAPYLFSCVHSEEKTKVTFYCKNLIKTNKKNN